MQIDLELLENLKTLSLSGSHPRVWVSAALVYRGKIISIGTNQMKTHPYQRKYGKNDDCIFWHAETSVIYNAEKKFKFDKFDKSVLYVARMKFTCTDKKGFISGLAKPCDGCMRCIQDYGIKTVIYTLNHERGSKNNFGVLQL